MSMSVDDLRRGRRVFHQSYANLCTLKNLHRPSIIAKNIASLEIDADHIPLEEWSPILISLERDQSLTSISLRCRFQCSDILEEIDDEAKCLRVNRRPLIFTRYVLVNVVEALSSCMRDADNLTCLKLNGILLDVEYMDGLCRGIEACNCLEQLTFKNCGIRDEGVSLLCAALGDKSTVWKVDLSQCGLTGKGAKAVAQLVAHQKVLRSNRGWTNEGGYGEEYFLGVKRITFNHNVYLGDGGCKSLMDVLKDDNWIKALDFQNCGLTDASAVRALEMLDKNSAISVVDMRGNQISACLLKQISLGIRSFTTPDCDWLAVEKCVKPKQPSPFLPVPAPKTRHCPALSAAGDSARASNRCSTAASYDHRHGNAMSSASTLKGISEIASCYSQQAFEQPEGPRQNVLESVDDADSVCDSMMGDAETSLLLSEVEIRARKLEIQAELEKTRRVRETTEQSNEESAGALAALRSDVEQERALRAATDAETMRLRGCIDEIVGTMSPREKQRFLVATKYEIDCQE